MSYEINVSLNGKHFFSTHKRSLTFGNKANEMAILFLEKFPKKEGYEVTLTEWKESGHPVDFESVIPDLDYTLKMPKTKKQFLILKRNLFVILKEQGHSMNRSFFHYGKKVIKIKFWAINDLQRAKLIIEKLLPEAIVKREARHRWQAPSLIVYIKGGK